MEVMTKTPLISIITPVYNAEKYLRACIDSVLSQSYQDYEMILVDDGSTDTSGAICDKYASAHDYINVIHKKNGGVSSARNIGLEYAKGEWVLFLDSDDTIQTDCLASVSSLIHDDIDIIIAGYRYVDPYSNNTVLQSHAHHSQKWSTKKAVMEMLRPSDGVYKGYICSKLLRASVIKEHTLRFDQRFPYGEDRLFLVEFLSNSKQSVIFTPHIVYNYYQWPSSAMVSLKKKYNPKYAIDVDASIKVKETIIAYTCSPYLRFFSLWEICESAIKNLSLMSLHDDFHQDIHDEIIKKLKISGAYWLFLIKYPIKRLLHPQYFRQ